jgi:hypothetical protein
MDAYRRIRRELATRELELARAHKVRTGVDVDRLLVRWEDFAQQVREGYWGTIHDYISELWKRDLIEELAASATPETRAFLRAVGDVGDRSFRSATTDRLAGWDISMYVRHGDGWWWTRAPVRPGNLRDAFPEAAWPHWSPDGVENL